MNHAEVNRSELERQAAVLRNQLGATLEELDRRRHEAFDLRIQARRHHLPLLLAITAGAAGAALLVGGTTWAVAHAVRRRRAARLGNKLRLLGEILRHPERLRRPQRPLRLLVADRLVHLGSSVLLGVVSSIASTALRLAFTRLRPPAAPAPQEEAVR